MLYFLDAEFGRTAKAIVPFAKEVRQGFQRSQGTGSGEGADFHAVAVVTTKMCDSVSGGKISLKDTKGWTSCHTRYGDLAGWAYPVYRLSQEGASGRDDIDLIKRWYKQSCAASNGAAELCTACESTSKCDLNDTYSGDAGVFRCMWEHASKNQNQVIGFVDNFVAERAFNPNARSDFQVLCDNGCHPVTNAAQVR